MKNTKLSLADFKAKADKIETMEALDTIHGGVWKILVEGAIYDLFKWGFSDMEGNGAWVSGSI